MKRCVTPRRIMEGDIQGIIKSGVRQCKGAEANIGGARLLCGFYRSYRRFAAKIVC
jgi:hypothetical protein